MYNAPQTFQGWIDEIFKELKDFYVVYFDDILVFSKIKEEHKFQLRIICDKFIKKNEIILSPKKYEVENSKIEFLGLNLPQSRIRLQDHIVTKIKDFLNELSDKKQL